MKDSKALCVLMLLKAAKFLLFCYHACNKIPEQHSLTYIFLDLARLFGTSTQNFTQNVLNYYCLGEKQSTKHIHEKRMIYVCFELICGLENPPVLHFWPTLYHNCDHDPAS